VQLNRFEREFESTNGRRIRYQGDIASVQNEWARYRLLKAQLAVVSDKAAGTATVTTTGSAAGAAGAPGKTGQHGGKRPE